MRKSTQFLTLFTCYHASPCPSNEKRSAWTCWVSGVKALPVDGDRVTALHTIAKIYAIDRDRAET